MNVAHQLCATLGMDFVQIIAGVHPSLVDSDGGHPKSISNDTIARLAKTIHSLREEKKLRLQKVQIYPNSEIHCLAISGYCWMIF
jgi:protein regulator of cytokinesis 1